MLTKTAALGALLGAGLAVCAVGLDAAAASPKSSLQPATMKVALRRITESQYRHTIADVFGTDIRIEARFEPERREDGLLALGSAELSLTSSGFEQYFALAGSIADQALAKKDRDAFIGCQPQDPAAPDDGCTRSFVTRYGERLFRRPLTESEIQSRLESAALGAKQSGDFHAGLRLAIASLLVAPDFLFRIEVAEPDPARPGEYRLDAWTKASRLSYLIWDSAPDAELLAAARSGALHSQDELERQIRRMLASPRFEAGTRAFFADMLQLDGFGNLVKDPMIYPKFNQSIAEESREQMLLRTVDLLVNRKGDYRDLFTSKESFISRPLASVYNVPYASKQPWTTYRFPEDSERSGILTDIGFLALNAHPGTSSPTRRGIKVLEVFMCQATPQPPANVDFSNVQDSKEGTVRGRLLDHMENEGCSGCHRRTDPLGLALEHFDGLGQLRTMENGVPIDVSAELKDVKLVGAQGVGEYLRNEPRVPACLVRNVYQYGVGRKTVGRDRAYLAAQTEAFAGSGYRFPDLVSNIASSPEFFKVVMPKKASPAATVAAAAAPSSSLAE